MSNLPHYADPARSEAILEAAESKAESRRQSNSSRRSAEVRHTAERNHLLMLSTAIRELERRAARRRFLPEEISTDTGWTILLDLFVSEHEGRVVKLSDSARSWDVSEATAARHVAALIETNLVVRVFDDSGNNPPILRLSEWGREQLELLLTVLN